MDDRATTPESLPPLELRELRNLDLSEPAGEGMAAHVASASGVDRRGDFVYVIGDDMLQLAVFEIAQTSRVDCPLAGTDEILDGFCHAGQKMQVDSS